MSRFADWLPAAAYLRRTEAGSFRDQDEINHLALGQLIGFLGQLFKFKVKPQLGYAAINPKPKHVKFRGVKDEITRATVALGALIQNTISAITELYDPNLSPADQDPELSRAEQSLIDLLSKLYDISALRKQYTVIRNSGKRATLSTIGNIFNRIFPRTSRNKKLKNLILVPQLASRQHQQIAKA